MFKKKIISMISIITLASILLVGCNTGEDEATESEELQVTASFSVIADIVEQVAGERANVDYVVPIGEEPHEHEPVPSDFQKVTDSDLFFVNGLGLEEWLESLMDNVTDTPAVELSEGIDTIKLADGETDDPHAWLDPNNVNTFVDNILDELIEIDPDGEEVYRENAENYKQELADLDEMIQEKVEQVPEENRLIVLSEDAFIYFGAAYGLETEGIWELNAHEEGTPQQIARVVDLLGERDIPYVFLESTINPVHMETVSSDSGVPIYDMTIFTDAVAEDGDASSYIGMMEHNVEAITSALTE
ncbi:metal ABC transporter solute-binding protein, Zn/Mn family [Alkalibacillus haloalkaliphilus]|uniref:metal ABC transporter solute-binding protein, Zn/Mn family n=1 Tax=Alkalibacillus haloalkaliphilus TaxID=94136 RepID=UPI002936480E|nr:zinc ABC transporter substrate-binding protein [Alkalibacillus haloalkaliphilus]MDV2582902.1 zinc ABC transporter substrate-binding protein [Alkalibacillus haloalkaliphilus]